MSQVLVKALRRLLDAHPKPVAASVMTREQKKQLDEFSRRTHSILLLTKGRGVSYLIQERSLVELTLRQFVPDADFNASLPQRAKNIAATRSSKKGPVNHDVTYVLAKTVGDPTWYQGDTKILELQRGTNKFGAVALEIGGQRNHDLRTLHPLWLVENQALFDQLNWLPTDKPSTVIWYRGQLHNKLIEWLSVSERTIKVYFFADYDGVGLNNFRRLKDRLQQRAEFWLMPHWRARLTCYGQNQLWIDTAREFSSFERKGEACLGQSKELRALIEAMKKQGLALEQEAVWLSITQDGRFDLEKGNDPEEEPQTLEIPQ